MNSTAYIDDFIAYVAIEKGLSANTQQSYKRDLEAAYAYCKKERLPWPMNYQSILSYMKALQAKNLKETSQVRSLISIKMFSRFLLRESIIDRNDSALLESPTIWQTIPSILNVQQIELLMNVPSTTTNTGVRDRAILETLYGTGIRVSELCGLSIYDVTDETVRVLGKGNKERLVPIGTAALQAIDLYLSKVRSRYNSHSETHLFVSNRGTKMDRISVWRMIRRYARQVGFEQKISPHTFRHTYASHLLDAGADVRVIQELLGHAHISSTDRYTQISAAHLQEAFRSCHPRWRSKEAQASQLPQ